MRRGDKDHVVDDLCFSDQTNHDTVRIMPYNITVVGCVIRERATPLITLITQKNMNDRVIVHLGNVGVILSFYCYGWYVLYGHAEIMKFVLFRVKRGDFFLFPKRQRVIA